MIMTLRPIEEANAMMKTMYDEVEFDIDFTEELTELFESLDIEYNATIVSKLGSKIEALIASGDLSNPDPDFADNFHI